MRPLRNIEAEQNTRIEQCGRFEVVKHDGVKPEPEGTIVLLAFRISGYRADCDGSLMAALERIDGRGQATGWEPDAIMVKHDNALVVGQEELEKLFQG